MQDEGLFREEALRRWREGGTQGEILRLAPGWTRWAVAVLLLLLAAVATWAAVAEVETARGTMPLRELLLPKRK
jgi:hypothetical protein